MNKRPSSQDLLTENKKLRIELKNLKSELETLKQSQICVGCQNLFSSRFQCMRCEQSYCGRCPRLTCHQCGSQVCEMCSDTHGCEQISCKECLSRAKVCVECECNKQLAWCLATPPCVCLLCKAELCWSCRSVHENKHNYAKYRILVVTCHLNLNIWNALLHATTRRVKSIDDDGIFDLYTQ
jgi:hypothetical protein